MEYRERDVGICRTINLKLNYQTRQAANNAKNAKTWSTKRVFQMP